MDDIICIELPSQVGTALKIVRNRKLADYRLIALTPHVEYALEELGQDYKRPEDYHSEQDINRVGLEDLANLERFCGAVDEFLQSRWDILAEHDICPANLNWYYLKNLFNSVSIRAFILRRIFEAEKPRRILFFDTNEETISRQLVFTRESAWSRMIPLAGSAFNIPCESLGGHTDPGILGRCLTPRPWNLKRTARELGRRVIGPARARWLLSRYRRSVLAFERMRSSFRKRGPTRPFTVLALESSYSLIQLLGQIKAQNSFNILCWDIRIGRPPRYQGGPTVSRNIWKEGGLLAHQAQRGQGARLVAEIGATPEIRLLLRFSGTDCFPVLERRLRRFLEDDLPELVGTYMSARALLRSESPVAVLASTMGDYKSRAVALAARHAQIPFVLYQHGDTAGHIQMKSGVGPVVEKLDLELPSHVLTFGDGDAEYLSSSRRCKSRIIPVGSASLDQLKKNGALSNRRKSLQTAGLDPEKKLVIYVPTDMEGNVRVAPYRNRTPSLTFKMQRMLLDVFCEFPEIQFVFKLHVPTGQICSPIAQVVKDRRPKNCVVITDPLSSVLPLADMFLTDYPSTTFLEMLTTDRPILVWGYKLPRIWNLDEWHPSILEMWQERVVYEEGLEEFLDLLRDHLRENRFQPVESQNILLKQFGTHLDDGKSAERAHEFLESLAR